MFNKRLLTIATAVVTVFALAVGVSLHAAAQDQQSPYLGITPQSADNGVLVESVAPDSPAAKAELKAGDIITAVNGKNVTADTIRDVLGALKVGDSVKLSVQRDGKTLDLTATLAARPAQAQPPANGQPGQAQPPAAQRPFLGIALQDDSSGVSIQSVQPNSPAEKAGLKQNDIITQVNGKDVKAAQDVVSAISALKVGDTVKLAVKRGTETVNVEATLAAAPMQAFPGFPGGRNGRGFRFNGEVVIYNANDKTWDVMALSDSSPLYQAGLRQGDKITQINGQSYDPQGLSDYLKNATGDVKVTVQRDGKDTDLTVPATALQNLGQFSLRFGNGGGIPFGGMNGAYLGVQFVMLDEQVAKAHNVTATVGALITQVEKDSPADKAGLKANDVVTAVNGDNVNAENTLRDRLANAKSGDKVTLDVNRGGSTQKIDVTLGSAPMGMDFPFQFGGPDGGFFNFEGPDGQPFPFQMPQIPMQPGAEQTPAAPQA
jgi:S1-C subfamily serine protease